MFCFPLWDKFHNYLNKENLLNLLEETRVHCVEAGLISTILSNLDSDDPNIVLQSLRAIGNISFDNGKKITFMPTFLFKSMRFLLGFLKTT